eukprot:6188790-Pleurochrysis_carterae.AAC.2
MGGFLERRLSFLGGSRDWLQIASRPVRTSNGLILALSTAYFRNRFLQYVSVSWGTSEDRPVVVNKARGSSVMQDDFSHAAWLLFCCSRRHIPSTTSSSKLTFSEMCSQCAISSINYVTYFAPDKDTL